MNWTFLVILGVVVVGMLVLRLAGQISAQSAREQLRNGALVVDVRSEAEFASGHLVHALNFPVDRIATEFPIRVQDRNQAILLHCQSGMRSGIASRRLRTLGYANAFNLGSHGRAARIVRGG